MKSYFVRKLWKNQQKEKKMSKGRGLALLKAIKERQLQEESQPTRSEIGENEKSRLIEALKERKKALEATEASQGNFSETNIYGFFYA